ncbi:MAG: HIRAN domain-containing protein [Solobacterium sp.]|nr:HIRAN domain-containing protein [Solobacterium sp.]
MNSTKKIYITVAGTGYYYGTEFLERGMLVNLKKEPDNKYDHEAIEVRLPGLGTIGHVANSWKTVAGDCMSAGRLYDKISEEAEAVVMYILPDKVICEVCMETEVVL